MSYNYINGVSYPVFEITDQYGAKETQITLPLTNSGGLIEEYEEKTIEYEYLNYVRDKIIKGYNVNFTLYYDEYTSKSTTSKIMQLLNWEYAISNNPAYSGYRIYLTPRADVPSRKFHVIGRNNSITLGVHKGGLNAMGHRGIVLRYTTKYLSNPQATDPLSEVLTLFDDLIVTA